MVSLITVLNGNVRQLLIISIFLNLAHLVCLFTELDESFGLFSYCTKWIYQFRQSILHCLSVHSNLVCFITLLNVIYVQIDNLMEVS